MVIILILNTLWSHKRRNTKKNQKLFDFFTLFIKKNTNFASLSFYRCGVKKLRKLIEWQFDCWIVDKVLEMPGMSRFSGCEKFGSFEAELK